MGTRVGVGVLAALLAGAALGALARCLMALVSLAAGDPVTVTPGGTSFVLLLYAAVMVPGGAVAGMTTRRLRWVLLAAGALFLCVPAIGVTADEVGDTAGVTGAQLAGVWLAGAAVFATIPLLPLLTVRLTDRWLGRRTQPGGSRATSSAALSRR